MARRLRLFRHLSPDDNYSRRKALINNPNNPKPPSAMIGTIGGTPPCRVEAEAGEGKVASTNGGGNVKVGSGSELVGPAPTPSATRVNTPVAEDWSTVAVCGAPGVSVMKFAVACAAPVATLGEGTPV
jgi:hypothetical protein